MQLAHGGFLNSESKAENDHCPRRSRSSCRRSISSEVSYGVEGASAEGGAESVPDSSSGTKSVRNWGSPCLILLSTSLSKGIPQADLSARPSPAAPACGDHVQVLPLVPRGP